MKELESMLLEANSAFNQTMERLNLQRRQIRLHEQNQPKQITEEELMDLDFGCEETFNLLISSVPEYVYDRELVQQTEELKLRYICPERKARLFGGYFQRQKIAIKEKNKLVEPNRNLVPEDQNPRIQVRIKWKSKQEQISLKSDDFRKLKEREDLNDTIMASYLQILKIYMIPPEIEQKIFIFSTFFMGQLMTGAMNRDQNVSNKKQQEELRKRIAQNYPKVKNWTRKIDIFSMEYLLIPMNPCNHWNIIIVLNPGSILTEKNTCRIIGLDSMFDIKQIYFQVIKIYLQLKASEVCTKQIQADTIKHYQLLVPRQTNNHDCGLYSLTYIQTIFTNSAHIDALKNNVRDFLHLFPRQLVQTMRGDLKYLFYSMMQNCQNQGKIIAYLEQYKNCRNKMLTREDGDYDEIDSKQFQKYCKLFPFYTQEDRESLIIKFYLDGDINYYEKRGNSNNS